jgi:hypothetical protein
MGATSDATRPVIVDTPPADGWSRLQTELPVTCLGLWLGGLTAEEALALERPAMTYVRAQLGDRLQRQLARAYRRWRRQASGRRPGDRFL